MSECDTRIAWTRKSDKKQFITFQENRQKKSFDTFSRKIG